MSKDRSVAQQHALFRNTQPGVRLSPLRNHRPLFIPDHRFWPDHGQWGACGFLLFVIFCEVALIAWQLVERHHS